MGRDPRDESADSLFHVTTRGTGGKPVFRSDDDRQWFLKRLAQVRSESAWKVLDYCLMDNHVHLLIRLGERGMSAGMQRLLTGHAHRFNALHDHSGHLFGSRYFSKLVKDEEHHWAALRYIAYNPVVAGLARTPADWRWSGYRVLAGLDYAPGVVDRDVSLEYVDGMRGYRCLTETPPPTLEQILAGGSSRGLARALAHGFTQREIASVLGISQATVNRRLRESGVPGTLDSLRNA